MRDLLAREGRRERRRSSKVKSHITTTHTLTHKFNMKYTNIHILYIANRNLPYIQTTSSSATNTMSYKF